MSNETKKVFLTAEWRQLIMLNYEISPSLLAPFLPAGTEVDTWNGRTLVSMVGFLFLKTRVWRILFPFHGDFEEVNLRFYVRRKADGGWRRGVVFIKEIVPHAVIAFAARKFYNESYVALPMSHKAASGWVEYTWRFRGHDNSLKILTDGNPQDLRVGSEAEFITEHYWGYSRQRDGSTMEYRVEHPRWQVRVATEAHLDADVAALYGDQFAEFLSGAPASAFLAEGSDVTVYRGEPLQR